MPKKIFKENLIKNFILAFGADPFTLHDPAFVKVINLIIYLLKLFIGVIIKIPNIFSITIASLNFRFYLELYKSTYFKLYSKNYTCENAG